MTNSKVKVLAVSALALASSFFTNIEPVKAEPAPQLNLNSLRGMKPAGPVITDPASGKPVISQEPNHDISSGFLDFDGLIVNKDNNVPVYEWFLRLGGQMTDPSDPKVLAKYNVDKIIVPDDSIARLKLVSDFDARKRLGAILPDGQVTIHHFSVIERIGENILLIAKDQATGNHYAQILPAEGEGKAANCKSYNEQNGELGECSNAKLAIPRDEMRYFGNTLFKMVEGSSNFIMGGNALNRSFGDNKNWSTKAEKVKRDRLMQEYKARKMKVLRTVLEAK